MGSRRTERRRLARVHKQACQRKAKEFVSTLSHDQFASGSTHLLVQSKPRKVKNKKNNANLQLQKARETTPFCVNIASSYRKYEGVKGTYGNYGTALIQTPVLLPTGEMSTGCLMVAIKTYRSKREDDLVKELETLRFLRKANCSFCPMLYGKVDTSNTNAGAKWGIAMERLPATLHDVWNNKVGMGEFKLPKFRQSVSDALALFQKFLKSAKLSFGRSHKLGITHRDIKPNNVGVRYQSTARLPVRNISELEIVYFDWGMSTNDILDRNLYWKDGTKQYSQKYWFVERQGHPKSVDYFQCLMLVFSFMVDIDGKYYATVECKEGAKSLGQAWGDTERSSNNGWLSFLLFHDEAVCSSSFHRNFCSRAAKYRDDYEKMLGSLDRSISSHLKHNNLFFNTQH